MSSDTELTVTTLMKEAQLLEDERRTIRGKLDSLNESYERCTQALNAVHTTIDWFAAHYDVAILDYTDADASLKSMPLPQALDYIANQNDGVLVAKNAAKTLHKLGYFTDYAGGRDTIYATLRRLTIQKKGWAKGGRGEWRRTITTLPLQMMEEGVA